MATQDSRFSLLDVFTGNVKYIICCYDRWSSDWIQSKVKGEKKCMSDPGRLLSPIPGLHLLWALYSSPPGGGKWLVTKLSVWSPRQPPEQWSWYAGLSSQLTQGHQKGSWSFWNTLSESLQPQAVVLMVHWRGSVLFIRIDPSCWSTSLFCPFESLVGTPYLPSLGQKGVIWRKILSWVLFGCKAQVLKEPVVYLPGSLDVLLSFLAWSSQEFMPV